MALSNERKYEIAYAVLKLMLKEQGISIGQHFRRSVGNWAKKTGIPFAEMLEFGTVVISEIFDEVTDPKKPPTPDEL